MSGYSYGLRQRQRQRSDASDQLSSPVTLEVY
jgi:hypothetical protein